MLLCDIGNTSYHFLDDEKDYKKAISSFKPKTIEEKVYYISVNAEVNAVVEQLENWIDLSSHIDKSQYYETMGIDRIVAVESQVNAVIVDAGSAITVDLVKNSQFKGGFIYPGVDAMRQTYKNISPALDYSFNFDLDFDIMPKNSQDAISYGFLKTLYSEVMRQKLPVVLTGGNTLDLQKIFKNANINERLIFDGMKQIIKKAKLC